MLDFKVSSIYTVLPRLRVRPVLSLQLETPGLYEDTLAWPGPALEHMKVTDISCQLLISWPSP